MRETIEFHFKGTDKDISTLPVEYMINLLSNMQDLMYFIASAKENKSYDQRFKTSKSVKENYIMECELPKKGCYAQTIAIEDRMMPLLDGVYKNHIADDIKKLIKDIKDNNIDSISKIFPNLKQVTKALTFVKNAFPSANDKIYVAVNNDAELDSRTIQKKTSSIIDTVQHKIEDHRGVVTGRLKAIDFEGKKIVIQYPITKKDLNCCYNDDIEDMLIENRRQLIQITGDVILDDDENPQKISDVVNIQEVDLSPLDLNEITGKNIRLRFKKPLRLTPFLDETKQLYCIELPELNIDVCEYTRADLENAVSEQFLFLWQEYALEDENNLTKQATILKNRILSYMEEVK